MMDDSPEIARGDEYVAIFTGGPNDGNVDTRLADENGWDTEVIVNGLEEAFPAQFLYRASGTRSVGDKVHVTYVWDPTGGDELEDPMERNDR